MLILERVLFLFSISPFIATVAFVRVIISLIFMLYDDRMTSFVLFIPFIMSRQITTKL